MQAIIIFIKQELTMVMYDSSLDIVPQVETWCKIYKYLRHIFPSLGAFIGFVWAE